MYQHYFGFKERPFQLVPNPAYLFLSRSHEEAMAHLTYAISEGDGFTAIIGEVGTGKTTLCRAFIENLDDHREVAYIFNPKLTAVELLKAVCDEFGIHVPKGYTTKDLNDVLNHFLLEKRAEGKQVMLIIDEAQKLSRKVLDQLRLLSNLETNTEKLLQIVLVGQPELDDLLKSYELRQLNQRITLSCHLTPLTSQETTQYIQYRIHIAARNQGVEFTKSAFRKIFDYSGGIPRLIHIVCDRSLLTCYVKNREKISGLIVNSAIRELNPRDNVRRLRVFEKRKTALLASMLATLLLLLVVMLFARKPMDSDTIPKTDSTRIYKIPTELQKKETPEASTAPSTDTPASSESTDGPVPEIESGPSEIKKTPHMPAKPESDQTTAFEQTRRENFFADADGTELQSDSTELKVID